MTPAPEASRAAWTETPAARVIGTLGLVMALATGIWMRFEVWPPGPTSDETSILQPVSDFGMRAIIDSPEAATNPPLFRLIFALLDEPVRMYRYGRMLNALCGLLAPAVVFLTARWAAGGDSVAGAIAAAVVALNPTLAVESLSFRVYGLLALVAALRLICLCVLAGERVLDPRSRAWVPFVGLTVVLPWLHYSSIPLLCFEAVVLAWSLPQHRRLLFAHAAAGVLSVPALLLLLKWRAILPPPPPSGGLIVSALPLWIAGYSRPGVKTLLGLLALIVFGCTRAGRPGRAMFGHALAWVGAALAVASYRAIRAGSLSITAVPLGITLGLLGTVLPRRWRYFGHGVVAMVFLSGLPSSLRSDLLPIGYPNPGTASAIAFAAELRQASRPLRLHVYPSYNMGVLQYQLVAAGERRGWTQCGAVTPSTCSPDQRIQLFGVESLQSPPPGRLVVLDCDVEPIGCRKAGGYPCAKVFECP